MWPEFVFLEEPKQKKKKKKKNKKKKEEEKESALTQRKSGFQILISFQILIGFPQLEFPILIEFQRPQTTNQPQTHPN